MRVFLLDLYWMQIITENELANEVGKGNVPPYMIDFSLGYTKNEMEAIQSYCVQEA